jgi:nucleoside-diphosphate-sugar epimerase
MIPTPEAVPLSVPDPLNPRYSYGGGKIICELMAVNYGRKYFDRTIIFRPHNVYGPDMGWEHVIPQFSLRMKELIEKNSSRQFEFPIKGDGHATRSFIYIDDFIDGMDIILNKAKGLEIYHVGTMNEVSMKDVAQIVARCFDAQITLSPMETPKGETPRRCPDNSKLKLLGFNPEISIDDGIKRTVEWYNNNAHLKGASL